MLTSRVEFSDWCCWTIELPMMLNVMTAGRGGLFRFSFELRPPDFFEDGGNKNGASTVLLPTDGH
jgi:hypothetical protein